MTSPATDHTQKVIVALDYPNVPAALVLVQKLSPGICKLKIGFELFTAGGPGFVETLVHKGYDVFLDLKFHDIPNTVAAACGAAARLGVWMINVHTLGGRKMMFAAREALEPFSVKPLLIGVTVLTSHDENTLTETGIRDSVESQVTRLALLAKDCGLDGVVCSARETSQLRARLGKEFCLVTPGIRPTGSAHGDQARVVTPAEAIRSGSSYIVVGRPITGSPDPVRVLLQINQDIS